jgi:hypothetical protein
MASKSQRSVPRCAASCFAKEGFSLNELAERVVRNRSPDIILARDE